jgi:hypothetical protein
VQSAACFWLQWGGWGRGGGSRQRAGGGSGKLLAEIHSSIFGDSFGNKMKLLSLSHSRILLLFKNLKGFSKH